MMLPKLEGPKPHPNAPSGPRRKITPRKKPSKPPGGKEEGKGLNKSDGGDLEMGMLPPLWSPTAGSNKSSSNESLSWSHLDEEKYALFKTNLIVTSIGKKYRLNFCFLYLLSKISIVAVHYHISEDLIFSY